MNLREKRRTIMVRWSTLSILMMLVFGILAFIVFWLIPLADLNSITTPTQDPDYSDSNFYLYHAALNCSLPADQREYYVTWSSTGIVAYLTASCLVSGNYLFFVVTNSIVLSISYLYYLASFKRYQLSKGIFLLNSLCIHTLVLLLSPGKEIISFSALCLTSGAINRLESNPSHRTRYLLTVLIGILLSASSRLHEGAILAIAVALYFSYRTYGFKAVFILSIAAIGIIDTAISLLLNVNFSDLLYESTTTQDSSIIQISRLLTSEVAFINAMMSPIRVALVPLGSLMQLFSEINIADFSYFVYRDLLQRIRVIDMTILLIGLYKAWSFRGEPISSAFFITLLSLAAITWPGILEKSRYYFVYVLLLTPFIVMKRRRPI